MASMPIPPQQLSMLHAVHGIQMYAASQEVQAAPNTYQVHGQHLYRTCVLPLAEAVP